MAQETHLRVVIDSRQALRDARAISTELQSIEKNGDYAAKSMNGASTAVREFAGYMAGIVTVGAAISKMDAYTGINNQLKLVTNSQVQLTGAMNETFAIAQRSRSSWESVTQVYQKLAMNAEAAGIAQKDIGRLTETISKGIALSGSSSEQAAAAIMQLGQSLGAGKLSGDEFNSVMENGYGVMQLLAKGMNVPIGQLKKLAGEGKLTSEVVTQALLKMSSTADAEFAKTDATIGQSLGMLSNAVTQFVGEAGKGSGAANLLSGSIQALAGNLDLIADTAVVGGVAYLTKTIVGQTIATQGAISASVARRASMLGELESVVQATTAEVSRTAAIAQLRNMQLADAQATAARMTGIQRLAYVQNTVIPLEAKATAATAAHTAAVEADTLAQDANSAARSRAAKLFTVLGGWTGVLTIGVAGLAAGYMYLKDRTAEANKKLEEQANVAKKAKDELIALKGLEKDSAINDMTAAFERQNKALAESSSRINMQLNAIEQLYKGNKEIVQVVQDARNGTISMSEAIQRFNELRISKEVYESVKANTAEFEKNAREATNTKAKLNLFGIEVELSGRKAQTAVAGVNENTKALDKNKTAADKAAKAQKDYFDSLHQEVLSANERLAYMNLGYPKEVIDQINKLQEAKQKALGDGVTAIVTTEEINQILQAQKALDAVEDRENAITEAKRKQNKESEKKYQYTQAELKMLQKVAALSAKYDLDGIGAKYGIPKNYLAGLMAQESKGNANAVSPTGAIGYFQTTSAYRKDNGLSMADSKNLPVVAEVVARNLAKAYKELGDWEAAIRSHNAGLAGSAQFAKSGKVKGSAERNKEVANFAPSVNKWIVGLGGSSLKDKGAADAIDDLKEYSAFLKEQAENRKRIELDAADEIAKVRLNLATKLEEIDKAGFSSDKVSELKFQAQQRADIEIQILEAAKQDKIASYSDYMKSEEQLLNESYARRQRDLKHDLDLTAEEYTELSLNLEKQRQQELAWMKLAQEQRIFEAEQFMMGEMERLKKRYTFEYMEIAKITDLEERRRKISALNANFIRGGVGKVSSDLNDTSGQFLKSMNYASVPKTNLQRLDEDNEKTLQKLRDNLAAVKESERTSHEERLEAERIFLEAKQQLQDEYDFKAFDARKADQENQLQLYNQMLTSASSTWGSLTNMVKGAKDENSKTFKAMFLAQQSMAIAQQIINTELAAGATTAQTGVFGLPAATAIRALGYASVGIIAGQTIAGMAHNGIDNIPKEGTWLLDGGERVLNPQQNRDLTQYLSVQRETRQTNLVAAANAPAPQINIEVINQVRGVTVETEQISEREIRLIVRDEMPKAFEEQISNPNSRVSRAVSKNTTARRNR